MDVIAYAIFTAALASARPSEPPVPVPLWNEGDGQSADFWSAYQTVLNHFGVKEGNSSNPDNSPLDEEPGSAQPSVEQMNKALASANLFRSRLPGVSEQVVQSNQQTLGSTLPSRTAQRKPEQPAPQTGTPMDFASETTTGWKDKILTIDSFIKSANTLPNPTRNGIPVTKVNLVTQSDTMQTGPDTKIYTNVEESRVLPSESGGSQPEDGQLIRKPNVESSMNLNTADQILSNDLRTNIREVESEPSSQSQKEFNAAVHEDSPYVLPPGSTQNSLTSLQNMLKDVIYRNSGNRDESSGAISPDMSSSSEEDIIGRNKLRNRLDKPKNPDSVVLRKKFEHQKKVVKQPSVKTPDNGFSPGYISDLLASSQLLPQAEPQRVEPVVDTLRADEAKPPPITVPDALSAADPLSALHSSAGDSSRADVSAAASATAAAAASSAAAPAAAAASFAAAPAAAAASSAAAPAAAAASSAAAPAAAAAPSAAAPAAAAASSAAAPAAAAAAAAAAAPAAAAAAATDPVVAAAAAAAASAGTAEAATAGAAVAPASIDLAAAATLVAVAAPAAVAAAAGGSAGTLRLEAPLTQFQKVVRVVENPSNAVAGTLAAVSTVGVFGGLVALPFLIGRRRRRSTSALDVAGNEGEIRQFARKTDIDDSMDAINDVGFILNSLRFPPKQP